MMFLKVGGEGGNYLFGNVNMLRGRIRINLWGASKRVVSQILSQA